jgi:hypothetical protein
LAGLHLGSQTVEELIHLTHWVAPWHHCEADWAQALSTQIALGKIRGRTVIYDWRDLSKLPRPRHDGEPDDDDDDNNK